MSIKRRAEPATWCDWDQVIPAHPAAKQLAADIDLAEVQHNVDFGACFDGVLRVEITGRYTFFLNSDDGSRLLIDGGPSKSYYLNFARDVDVSHVQKIFCTRKATSSLESTGLLFHSLCKSLLVAGFRGASIDHLLHRGQ